MKNYQDHFLEKITKKYQNSGSTKQEATNEDSINSTQEVEINIVPKKKKYTRKSPNQLAKTYEIGFKMISENDGNQWEVQVTKTGQKRWKRVK